MRRWHQEYRLARREQKQYRDWLSKWGPSHVDNTEVGRFRKNKAFDCGQTGCFGCHSDKYPKRILTARELEAELHLIEEIQNMNVAISNNFVKVRRR